MTAEQASRATLSGDKAQYVRDMFAGIANRYDLLNNILSFSRHKAWRKYAVRLSEVKAGDKALDICTGTGDFALDLFHVVGASGMVAASDFCAEMVYLGKEKTDRASGGKIGMMIADAQSLPYNSNQFDCVTVGFGIRNVADRQRAFNEMTRVARPGGRIVCLEFNQPRSRFWRPFVNLYHRLVLTRIGGLFSNREAYSYLVASINEFHSREELSAMMERAGLQNIRVYNMNLDCVCVHIGTKRGPEQVTAGSQP